MPWVRVRVVIKEVGQNIEYVVNKEGNSNTNTKRFEDEIVKLKWLFNQFTNVL